MESRLSQFVTQKLVRMCMAILASLGLVAGLAACSNTPSTPESTKAGKVSVVTSTPIWADVVKAVTDDDSVTVESIIEGNSIDPHGFEPTAADMAKAEKADIIVVGGGGYDSWLYSHIDQSKVVHALPLSEDDHDHDHGHAHGDGHDHDGHDHEATAEATHDHEHEGEGELGGELAGADDNEHVWYDTEALGHMVDDIAEALQEHNADVKLTKEKAHVQIDKLDSRLHELKGANVAQTHPIADHILLHTELGETTPEGYRKTTLSESEPTAADINSFLEAINAGKVQILIDSPQTEAEYSKRIRKAAEDKNIPVVDVYETPDKGVNFFDLYDHTITELEGALKKVPSAASAEASVANEAAHDHEH